MKVEASQFQCSFPCWSRRHPYSAESCCESNHIICILVSMAPTIDFNQTLTSSPVVSASSCQFLPSVMTLVYLCANYSDFSNLPTSNNSLAATLFEEASHPHVVNLIFIELLLFEVFETTILRRMITFLSSLPNGSSIFTCPFGFDREKFKRPKWNAGRHGNVGLIHDWKPEKCQERRIGS